MEYLSARELVRQELVQRAESGYVVGDLAREVEQVLADEQASEAALLGLYDRFSALPRHADWRYDEPDGLEEILRLLPTPRQSGGAPVDVGERLHGAWLGRCVGCNLGKAIEWGDHWTPEHIKEYLTLAKAWPLADYIPVLDPMPGGFELHDSWPETTRGNINGSARDDDIDFAMLALHVMETHGSSPSTRQIGEAWLERLPVLATYTAERVAYRNLVDLVELDEVGSRRNPYREWIGAQIRADVFGYVNPGNPRQAAVDAYQDARLSHRGNGIYAEMWAAALVAEAFVAESAYAAVTASLDHIPASSRLHEAVRTVLADFDRQLGWEEARRHIHDRFGAYGWVHTINNACVLTAGLLWGDGDFSASICLTVSGGLDTDSNGATAGSVAGILSGRGAIAAQWADPLHDVVHSALAGFDRTRISDLAERTIALVRARPPAHTRVEA